MFTIQGFDGPPRGVGSPPANRYLQGGAPAPVKSLVHNPHSSGPTNSYLMLFVWALKS